MNRIMSKSATGNAEIVAAPSSSLFMEMKDLLVLFMEKVLGIYDNNPRQKDQRCSLERAYTYVTSDKPKN
jgi:hypothetical protein